MTTGRAQHRRFGTLGEAIRAHALDGLPATVGAAHEEQLTYPAFYRRVTACATRLAERGVRQRDAVAVEMQSTTATLVATAAVWAMGGTLVPIAASGKLIPGTQDARRTLDALRAGGARWCVAADTDAYTRTLTEAGAPVTVLPTTRLTAPASGNRMWEPPTVDLDGPALVQFSSGSLAEPKGIVLTHRNLTANLDDLLVRTGLGGGRLAIWLPLSHDMGLVASFAGSLYGGTAVRVMPPRAFVRDPLRWIEELSAFSATHTAAPTFGYEMAERAAARAPQRLHGLDLSTMTAAVVGAERVPPELCERFEARFADCGLPRHAVLPAYGLAENCVAVAARKPLTPSATVELDACAPGRGRVLVTDSDSAGGPAADGERRRRLIGHGAPLPGTEVRIASAQGDPLPDGEVGEIWIRGQGTCRWYVDASGERRSARGFDDFLATGDLGALAGGELYVVGRVKESLSYAGRSISPADVEQAVLAAAPDQLSAAAAVSVSLRGSAESLVLFLELLRRADEDAERQLADAVRLAVLRDFRMPVQEVYVGRRGSLPRTPSGKVRRLSLGAARQAGALPGGIRPIPSPRTASADVESVPSGSRSA